METNCQMSDILGYLRKKWFIMIGVMFGGMIFFACLQAVRGVNKNVTSTVFEYSGIVDYPGHGTYVNEEGFDRYYDYTDLWYRSPVLQQFVILLDEHYEMDRIVSGWNYKNDTQRLAWVRTCFLSEPIANTAAYEFIFRIIIEEGDFNYLSQEGDHMLVDFIEYASESTAFFGGDHSYEVKWKAEQVATSPAISKTWVILKYAIIGGVMGSLAAALGLTLFYTSGKR